VNRIYIRLRELLDAIVLVFETGSEADEAFSAFMTDISQAAFGEAVMVGDSRGPITFLKRSFLFPELPSGAEEEDDDDNEGDEHPQPPYDPIHCPEAKAKWEGPSSTAGLEGSLSEVVSAMRRESRESRT
jgi:hypothetical protein